MRGLYIILPLIALASVAQAYDGKTIFLIGDRSSWLLDSMPDSCGTQLEPVCKRSAIAIYTDSNGNKMFDFYGQYVNPTEDNNFAGIGCKLITSDDQTEYRFWLKAGNCKSRSGTGYRGSDITINRTTLKHQDPWFPQTFTIGSASELRKIREKVNKKITSTKPKI